MRSWSFAKGHGTGNDFVLLRDRESLLGLTEAEVRFLCDRHFGIGGDGVLRAVLARHIPEWDGDGALWFMDYRNADGSLAEMCGNGLRVFVRFLLDQDLVSGPVVAIATRAGLKAAEVLTDGRIRVAMGPVRVDAEEVTVTTTDGGRFSATPAEVGNPHLVSFAADLDRLQLSSAPSWSPVERFPAGVNLEFVRPTGPHRLALRVHERGSGETLSCGTGTVAAAAVARSRLGDDAPLPVRYQIDVPGGSVEVELSAEQAFLTGPAVIVAHGTVTVPSDL